MWDERFWLWPGVERGFARRWSRLSRGSFGWGQRFVGARPLAKMSLAALRMVFRSG